MPNPKPESVDPRGAYDVSRPTMTVYAARAVTPAWLWWCFPAGLPGSGHGWRGHGGLRLADLAWYHCVLLKYRVPDSGPTMKDGRAYYPKVQTALQDAQRTLGLCASTPRSGMSTAQGRSDRLFRRRHLVAAVSTHFAQRTYPPVDAADELSSRPDFAIASIPATLDARDGPDPAPGHQRPRRRAATFLLQARTIMWTP